MAKLTHKIPRLTWRKKTRTSAGAAPGTFAVHADLPPSQLHWTRYDSAGIATGQAAITELPTLLAERGEAVLWVDVRGLGDEVALRQLGGMLRLHPLLLEDIAHVTQRAKYEETEDGLFVVTRCVRQLADGRIDNEQVSFLLRPGLLISFQEKPGDGFDPVRRRLAEGKGALRGSGADYLLWALTDVIVDLAFPVLETYAEAMDHLDDEVHDRPGAHTARAIHEMKRELRQLRRALWPMRDLVASLGRGGVEGIAESTEPMFRDCHDHALQMVDFIEGARERASDLADRYLAEVSERTNQVMKVLTIIATIFIPMTFVAGLYGMNFDGEVSPYNMPELRWRFGYPAFWAVLVLILVGQLWYFRRKGWLGGARARSDDENSSR